MIAHDVCQVTYHWHLVKVGVVGDGSTDTNDEDVFDILKMKNY